MIEAGKQTNFPHLIMGKGSKSLMLYDNHYCKLSDTYLNQHLYILSDEEIKEGDWFIWNDSVELRLDKMYKMLKKHDWAIKYIEAKKIIATTNPELHKPGYESVKHPSYIPKLPTDFIEKYVEEWNKRNVIKQIELDYEANVLLEDGDALSEAWKLKLCSNNIVIIHLVL